MIHLQVACDQRFKLNQSQRQLRYWQLQCIALHAKHIPLLLLSNWLHLHVKGLRCNAMLLVGCVVAQRGVSRLDIAPCECKRELRDCLCYRPLLLLQQHRHDSCYRHIRSYEVDEITISQEIELQARLGDATSTTIVRSS
jgi:hypothetical protein